MFGKLGFRGKKVWHNWKFFKYLYAFDENFAFHFNELRVFCSCSAVSVTSPLWFPVACRILKVDLALGLGDSIKLLDWFPNYRNPNLISVWLRIYNKWQCSTTLTFVQSMLDLFCRESEKDARVENNQKVCFNFIFFASLNVKVMKPALNEKRFFALTSSNS